MNNNDWIPVEEKMPPEDKWILLYNGHWRGVGKYNHDEYFEPNDEDGFKSPEWSDETGDFINPDPTHWMPLPEPPQFEPKQT